LGYPVRPGDRKKSVHQQHTYEINLHNKYQLGSVREDQFMAIRELRIPAGVSLLIGAPAEPMSQEISTAIGKLAESIDGIVEAHLPQMFAIGVMDEPAQVLVVVISESASLGNIIDQLGVGLIDILPDGLLLDILPLGGGSTLINDIRGSGCRI
jgi:hypothetical protein